MAVCHGTKVGSGGRRERWWLEGDGADGEKGWTKVCMKGRGGSVL